MSKNDMVRELARRTGLTQNAAQAALETLFGTKTSGHGIISDVLAAGERVTISGFGSWEVVHRAATRRVTPSSGVVHVPARKAVRFKASPGLLA